MYEYDPDVEEVDIEPHTAPPEDVIRADKDGNQDDELEANDA